jgi:putative IMPACT (imprinted ancient) family translation regulator
VLRSKRQYPARLSVSLSLSNSAGDPILGRLLSFDVTYSLGVVVRYFGGTKLGVGGLVTAYKKATQEALENASIVEAFVTQQFKFTYTYDQTSEVNRLLTTHQANIVHQTFEINCTTEVEIRSSLADSFYEQAKQVFGITVEKVVSP